MKCIVKNFKNIGLAFMLGCVCLSNADKNNTVVGKKTNTNILKTDKIKAVKKDLSLSKIEKAVEAFNKSMSKVEIDDNVHFMLDNSLLTVVDFLGMTELLGENWYTPASGKMVISFNTSSPDANLKKAEQAMKKLFDSLKKVKMTPGSAAFLYDYVKNAAGYIGKQLPNIKDISIENGKITYTIDSDISDDDQSNVINSDTQSSVINPQASIESEISSSDTYNTNTGNSYDNIMSMIKQKKVNPNVLADMLKSNPDDFQKSFEKVMNELKSKNDVKAGKMLGLAFAEAIKQL